jgi:hypothetical protein
MAKGVRGRGVDSSANVGTDSAANPAVSARTHSSFCKNQLVAGRADSDEHYVLDLCDEVLGNSGRRQERFEWLRGDAPRGRPRGVTLPVDGYWPDLQLVVEFQEEQHSQPSPFFDRRQTVSGVGRGAQRRLYDARKRDLIPQHGLRLVVIQKSAFTVRSRRIARDHTRDISVVSVYLEKL